MANEISKGEQIRLTSIINNQAIPVPDFDIDRIRKPVFDDNRPIKPNPENDRDQMPQPKPEDNKQPKARFERNLTKGKWRIKWESTKKLDPVKFANESTVINVDGIEKRVKIHSMEVKDNYVIAEINILENPIPLLLVGYAILGVAGLSAGGFFISEVNELTSNTGSWVLIGGAFYLVYKTGILKKFIK